MGKCVVERVREGAGPELVYAPSPFPQFLLFSRHSPLGSAPLPSPQLVCEFHPGVKYIIDLDSHTFQSFTELVWCRGAYQISLKKPEAQNKHTTKK